MISKRSVAIFFLTLVLTLGLAWAIERRDARCTVLLHSLARSAPWFSAKGGAHGFECGDYDHIPLSDKAVGAAWCLGLLAMLRSILVDIQGWRQRNLSEYPPDEPNDEGVARPPLRDAFSSKQRPGR